MRENQRKLRRWNMNKRQYMLMPAVFLVVLFLTFSVVSAEMSAEEYQRYQVEVSRLELNRLIAEKKLAELEAWAEDNDKIKSLKRAERNYGQLIREMAGKYNLDPALIKAKIAVESDAFMDKESKKAAHGLMGVRQVAADDVGFKGSIKDPRNNVEVGCKYFRKMLDEFEYLPMALAAYNAGPTLIRRIQRVPRNGETEKHIKRVLYLYYRAQEM